MINNIITKFINNHFFVRMRKALSISFLPNMKYIGKYTNHRSFKSKVQYLLKQLLLKQCSIFKRIVPTQVLLDKYCLQMYLLFVRVGKSRLNLCLVSNYNSNTVFHNITTKVVCSISNEIEFLSPQQPLFKDLVSYLGSTLRSHIDSIKVPSRKKITTTISLRFNKNYTICFLLKPTHTNVFNVIWSGRLTCFYKLVSPTYSKIHLKKYKKFLDLLVLSVYREVLSAKLITDLSLLTPNILDASSVINKKKHQITKTSQNTTCQSFFESFGFLSVHGDFFRSLKIRRGLPRRIRRKVLSKKIGRLWLNVKCYCRLLYFTTMRFIFHSKLILILPFR